MGVRSRMTTPHTFERQVAGSLRRAGFLRQAQDDGRGVTDGGRGATLVVAASGGPDSTALLRCLHRLSDGGLRDKHGLTLHVAHLNHDFRGAEADHDAAFVQRLADGLGLPCSIDKQDPIAYQQERGISSFEQAAREMRYAFLAAVSASVGATAIALGHTADDQAETVLLHLLRGSSLHGLRGMAEVTRWPWREPRPGPLLFRPLLGATKADTAAYCRALGQLYREDSGNYMWRFTRNKVRLDLMPKLAREYNPRVRDALARLSRAAADEVDYIESELSRYWPGVAEEREGVVTFNIPALSGLHPALRRHALRRAYAVVAGDARRLRENHLDAMWSLAQSERGGRNLHLPRGVRAHRDSHTLRLTRLTEPPPSLPALAGEYAIRLPQKPGERLETAAGGWLVSFQVVEPGQPHLYGGEESSKFTARLNRDALGEVATLRTRRPGDRFQPSGMTGTKKLQDFFTDAKIPREQRDHVPLLVCDKGIAWVVGRRVAEWAVAGDDAPGLWITMVPDGQ